MKIYILGFFLVFAILFSSCKTNNNVVSSGFIQKRKYTKGYHIESLSKNLKRNKSVSDENQSLAKQNIPCKKETASLKDIANKPVNMVSMPELLKSKSVSNNELSASADNRMPFIYHSNSIFNQQPDTSRRINMREDPPDTRQQSNIAILDFVFSMVALVSIIILYLLSLATSPVYMPALSFLIVVLMLVGGLGSFVLSLTALIIHELEPLKFKGFGWAIAGFCIFVLCIFLVVLITSLN